MNILYLLFIKPIETVLSFLFSTYVHLTGSYGLSIILLSLSVTTIMFPLFYIAEVWKRKEQAVEKRMKHRLAYIKKYFTGQKRYCMIKATHRLEGYTAASSFRTSFGLLIQIPFFFAAYHLLSHYEPYRGVSWLFIRDFALPDGLLWGLNLLPVAMTVINIVSSSIYMKGSRPKDIAELYIMAGVFLLLLYASPAALVLYWTMNNIFSIGKSLIFLRLFPHEKYVPDPEDKSFADYVRGIKETLRPCFTADLLSLFLVTVLFGYQCRILKIHKSRFVHLFILTAAVTFIFALVFFFIWFKKYRNRKEKIGTGLKVLAVGLIFVLISAGGFYLQLQDAEGSFLKKIIFIATIFADLLLYIFIRYILNCIVPLRDLIVKIPEKECRSLYIWGTFFLGLSVIVIWPVLVFLSSPAETGITVWSVLGTNIPVLFFWLLLTYLFFRLSGRDFRIKLAEVMLLLSIVAILYHYVLPCQYGELDKTMLGLEDKLNNRALLPWIGDIAVLFLCLVVVKICIRKYSVQCRNAIAVLLCCMIGLAGIRTVKYLRSEEAHIEKVPVEVKLPAANDTINGYSKNGKNVVLFLSDMFTGGYMVNILKEHPEYADAFTGFTWYKNALAPSYKTCGSMPSIFAGEEYFPLSMNEMPGTGREKIQKAAKILFKQFKDEGYSVSIVDGESGYVSPQSMEGTTHVRNSAYVPYWKSKYRKDDKPTRLVKQGHLLIMLTLFQNSPYFLKPIIYNESSWFIFSKKALYWTVEGHVFPNYSFMKLLPEVSNTKISGDTFKYIHNLLPHGPYGVNKEGEVIYPGEFPDENSESFYFGKSPYYSAVSFVQLFIKWLDWLKENNIYDNTYIILLADHGSYRPEHNPLTDSKVINRLNAMFMVKPYNSTKEALQIDEDTLVIVSDAVKFMENARSDVKVVIPEGRELPVVQFNDSDTFLDTGIIIPIHAYKVKDNIFDPKNWKEIQ